MSCAWYEKCVKDFKKIKRISLWSDCILLALERARNLVIFSLLFPTTEEHC